MIGSEPNDENDSCDGGSISRRAMLAAAGTGAAVSTSGCIRRVRSVVNRDDVEPLSLTITTLPADGDRESIQLAREIAAALETVGIDASIEMRSNEEFLRAILINQDFDVYVGRHPGGTDPSYLYEALHSRYADERGWQNPFGYANLAFDEFLEAQRAADGGDRQAAVQETLEALAVEQPFVPLCVPDEYRLVRTDRFAGWGDGHPASRLGYLGLERGPALESGDGSGGDDADGDEPAVLRTAHVDARPSQNLNPLSAEYRNRGTIIELLYDSLAVVPLSSTDFDGADLEEDDTDAETEDDGGESTTGTTDDESGGNGSDSAPSDAGTAPTSDLQPWLAADWEWDDAGETMTVELRENCRFHDDEPLTAEDVRFTYRFLADTGLGDLEVDAPAPLYRGRVDAVESVDRLDDHRLEITVDASRAVGERALTVPILPKHIWEPRAAAADVPGYRVALGTSEALVTNNVPPVGSGPYQFATRSEREHVTLERFDDHFTAREGVTLPGVTPDRLRFLIDPRSASAIERVETNEADITSTALESYVVDDLLGDAEAGELPEDVEVLESESWLFYHLGFNARKAPFSNPRFRRCVAQVLDKQWFVEAVFDGHARPIAAPVTEEWTPDSLRWDGEDPETPFLGTDGEIDVAAARNAFESAGFSYDGEGRLRVRR
ncbi:ABC transporter substrate-binding protein [Halopiger xanaduensis]|uniref:ABC-type transporter, periplasmic subunit n=1 Tax=Halopiger xanaduensis (strain DSM 18323 / JCM 14033 / SH-6) TaxID=797210 RepID=F8D498_HALXS|nr:ABC transporter substrate-binding protein [Halopiger xanaduensis]AEH37505.1 ABC-type transporter, periplasmic subunit [Halopiger xanaduensis SH-6]